MSNETDLDWLARNVHVWPTETDFVFVGTGIDHGNMGWYPANYCFSKSSLVTHQQWLSRRAELQNKPSWKDAPEWANWLGQCPSGKWEWYHDEEEPPVHADGDCWDHQSYGGGSGKSGEVLGDWRDTLEKRPEQAAFTPFTSIEDNQEKYMIQQQAMKQDSGWFERGELPPVGAVCEINGAVSQELRKASLEWTRCVVLSHTSFPGGAPIAVAKCDEETSFGWGTAKRFRPIRTERDELIDVLKGTHAASLTNLDMLASAILAAGFSLGDK